MVEHKFYKKVSPNVLEATAKAFSKLPPVTKLKMDRFELPINSIRRIYGEKFYDLTNTEFDLLNLVIDDSASFNEESLNTNNQQSTDISQMVAYLFQQFAIINRDTTFTQEFMNSKILEVAVTSTKGVKKSLISMMDLASVASFNDSNQITGIRYIKEITECSSAIQRNDAQYEKMKQTNNIHAMGQLDEERAQLCEKLHTYNMSIVKNFLDIIMGLADADKITDVYDVIFTFDQTIKDEKEDSESIRVKAMFVIHDVAAVNMIALENKFHVNHETVDYSSEEPTESPN